MATLNNKNYNLKQIKQDSQTAAANGYKQSNYQSGYGIGDGTNITGGFNGFNDTNALRNEIGRVETVMGNRNKYGLGNTEYDSYYNKLQQAYQPFTDAQNKATNAQTAYDTKQTANTDAYNQAFASYNNQITDANNAYKQSAGYQNYVQSMDQTVDSIASKYGFSFNRDTVRQQAEAEAQALRDANADANRKNESANKTNTAGIDANLMNMAEALDRNYFQQMMVQQQNQVNGGLNAGIAADQDLRLQMNRQAEMGSAHRDANVGKMSEQERYTNEQLRLADALGTINQQAIANANKGVQDWEMQMYDVISNDRNFYKDAANMEWGQSQDLVNQLIAQQDRLTSNYQADRDFDYGALRDIIGDSQNDRDFAQGTIEQAQAQQNWAQQFNYNANRDKVSDSQWNQEFNWNKILEQAGLTGNYGGQRTLDGLASDRAQQAQNWNQQMDSANLQYNYDTLAQRKAEFASDDAWRQYEFKNMSASQQAQLQQNSSQFGEEMAWKMYEMEYNGNLQRSMAEAELQAYTGGSNSASSTSGSLGSLSAKYESNGNAATIARTKGDIGGASYGTYQMTTASGVAQKFASSYGGQLAGKKAGTAAFDTAWKAEAAKNPAAFEMAQHNYIKQSHYEPAANKFKQVTGIDASKQPKAVQDMIWSIGVQHGSGGAATIFKNAGITAGMSAETILKRTYGERSKVDKYFSSSTPSIKKSVQNRFTKELQDALNMLKG